MALHIVVVVSRLISHNGARQTHQHAKSSQIKLRVTQSMLGISLKHDIASSFVVVMLSTSEIRH